MDIEWAGPEITKGVTNRGKAYGFVEALKTRPGHWAISPLSHAGTYTMKLRYSGVEVMNRAGIDYARWVGDS